jgi:hypothetical protein
MKGTLDDGTPVDIEKPEPIEQDGKWWEFVELRKPNNAEYYLFNDGVVMAEMERRNYTSEAWIASEIPRATPEQLAAIGMQERDGKPVECKAGYQIWNGKENIWLHNDCAGSYRFVLEPVVGKEVHVSCEGCLYDGEDRHPKCRVGSCKAYSNYTPVPPTTYTSCPDCAKLKAETIKRRNVCLNLIGQVKNFEAKDTKLQKQRENLREYLEGIVRGFKKHEGHFTETIKAIQKCLDEN